MAVAIEVAKLQLKVMDTMSTSRSDEDCFSYAARTRVRSRDFFGDNFAKALAEQN